MIPKNFSGKLIMYTDGGARGNPGPAAIGVVICVSEGGKETVSKTYSDYLGKATNNEAEYQAAIFALKKAKALFGKQAVKKLGVEIKSDSELLTKQLRGEYKVVNPEIQKLFLTLWNSKIDFGEVVFTHIPREANTQADRLVNKELDSQGMDQKLF